MLNFFNAWLIKIIKHIYDFNEKQIFNACEKYFNVNWEIIVQIKFFCANDFFLCRRKF